MIELMVSLEELYKIAILLCPVFSSLFAIVLLLLDVRSTRRKFRKLHYYLLAFFFSVFLSWFSAILYFYTPLVYVYLNWLSMLAFMLIQVFYYGFIFEVTRTDVQEKFSDLNYLFPVLLTFLLLFAFLITPVDDQLNTIMAKGVYKGGSKLFFYFNYSKMFFRLIFSLFYTILGFIRLSVYHRAIRDFSSNEEKNSLRWVTTLLFFSLLLIPIPLANMFSSREEMTNSPLAILFVLSLLYQYAYICLHVIKKDRYIIDLSDETNVFSNHNSAGEKPQVAAHLTDYNKLTATEIEKGTDANDEIGAEVHPGSAVLSGKKDEDEMSIYLKKNILNRDSFDAFMKVEKPYLNADLRITDLVDMLHVNRTYISSFINREYGVNFSAFINKYRLLEYNALKENPEYSEMSKSELAEMAGFNSYRSFQRTEKEFSESKKRVLGIKIFFNL